MYQDKFVQINHFLHLQQSRNNKSLKSVNSWEKAAILAKFESNLWFLCFCVAWRQRVSTVSHNRLWFSSPLWMARALLILFWFRLGCMQACLWCFCWLPIDLHVNIFCLSSPGFNKFVSHKLVQISANERSTQFNSIQVLIKFFNSFVDQ